MICEDCKNNFEKCTCEDLVMDFTELNAKKWNEEINESQPVEYTNLEIKEYTKWLDREYTDCEICKEKISNCNCEARIEVEFEQPEHTRTKVNRTVK